MKSTLLLTVLAGALLASATVQANPVVYKADPATANGKHLVFIASDHEYRGEETLPAMADVLSCTYTLPLWTISHVGSSPVTKKPAYGRSSPIRSKAWRRRPDGLDVSTGSDKRRRLSLSESEGVIPADGSGFREASAPEDDARVENMP